MANVVVVGAQWGDEGKGKIVDWLSERADIVVRFQGGHNAGHTLVVDGEVFKLSIMPSGIVRSGKLSVIGNGVVLDPWHFKKEIEKLRAQGITIDQSNLIIAENTPLILPIHGELDRARESLEDIAKIGTTGRGIGPAYEDKVGRRAIRVSDLADTDTLEERVSRLLLHHNSLRRGMGLSEASAEDLIISLKKIAPEILKYAAPVWNILNKKRRAGQRILFEGAQGSLLDIDFGSYPFVTSSNTIAAGACTGLGVPPNKIKDVFGIFKAYTTRVGGGPFPTELFDEDGETMGRVGNEFGATTGRSRRCGWIDLVALKYSIRINGVTQLMMMKGDVLSGFDKIKVCTSYETSQGLQDFLPYDVSDKDIKPHYEELEGWKQDLTQMTEFSQFPHNFANYIDYLEKELEIPIKIVSVGPDRAQTIYR